MQGKSRKLITCTRLKKVSGDEESIHFKDGSEANDIPKNSRNSVASNRSRGSLNTYIESFNLPGQVEDVEDSFDCISITKNAVIFENGDFITKTSPRDDIVNIKSDGICYIGGDVGSVNNLDTSSECESTTACIVKGQSYTIDDATEMDIYRCEAILESKNDNFGQWTSSDDEFSSCINDTKNEVECEQQFFSRKRDTKRDLSRGYQLNPIEVDTSQYPTQSEQNNKTNVHPENFVDNIVEHDVPHKNSSVPTLDCNAGEGSNLHHSSWKPKHEEREASKYSDDTIEVDDICQYLASESIVNKVYDDQYIIPFKEIEECGRCNAINEDVGDPYDAYSAANPSPRSLSKSMLEEASEDQEYLYSDVWTEPSSLSSSKECLINIVEEIETNRYYYGFIILGGNATYNSNYRAFETRNEASLSPSQDDCTDLQYEYPAPDSDADDAIENTSSIDEHTTNLETPRDQFTSDAIDSPNPSRAASIVSECITGLVSDFMNDNNRRWNL